MNRRPGFSLVELLMVMAIIVALGAAVLPAITNVSDGMRLTNATQMLMDEILVARATALSRNLPVEVWFVQDGETSEYRLLRTAVIDNSERTTWVTGYKRLPAGVAMTAAGGRSNLIAVQNARTLPDLALKGVALRINPSGQCEVADESATIGPNEVLFVTVVLARHASSAELPANFSTVQINPINTRLTMFRP